MVVVMNRITDRQREEKVGQELREVKKKENAVDERIEKKARR
jgi:chorismate mutase